MPNTSRITIDDGFKTYEIANKEGKVLGSFSFNPSDTNIAHRYEKAVEELEKLDMIVEEKGEGTLEEELRKLEESVFEQINYLLNADVAENFFSIMGPFSLLASGQYFVESVIDAIGQAISQETGARVKKMNNKIKKHTARYHA